MTEIEPHKHSWCVCFGACTCNQAFCNRCSASRDLTDDELAEKAAALAATTST